MSEKFRFQLEGDAIESALDHIRFGRRISGLNTGFTDLDQLFCGITSGELIVLGGRPSMGKTAFALSTVINMSVINRLPVAYFSLEVPKVKLIERLIRMVGLVEEKYGNDVDEETLEKLEQAAQEIEEARLFIDDSCGSSVEDMREKLSLFEESPRLVIIDYLQLVSGVFSYSDAGGQRSVINALKDMAKELSYSVLVLSQLNRRVDKRQDHRPIFLSDLKGSGDVEDAADKIMFLYRDEYYDRDSELKNIAEIYVVKNHNGRTGKTELVFMPECMRFFSLKRN